MKLTLQQASKMLQAGQVVAVPTETVYGLAASIQSTRAIKKIFTTKGRPQDNPLIVHVASLAQLKPLVRDLPQQFKKLKKFWPGPLTVVFKANKKNVPNIVRARLDTVAIRIPNHPLLLKLIKKTGPLAAPSANLSGKPSPTSVSHIYQDYGYEFPVLDGGVCRHGVESTIVGLSNDGWQVLRVGALSAGTIAKALGQKAVPKTQKAPLVPGQKYKHYAPKAKLHWCAKKDQVARVSKQKKPCAILGFDDSASLDVPLQSLGPRNAHKTNLKKLYAALRSLDQKKYQAVVVDADFKVQGLGATLFERLCRAAHKKQNKKKPD